MRSCWPSSPDSSDGGEAALLQIGLQMARGVAGVAEHDGGGRIEIAQQVDHRLLGLARIDPHGAIFDVGMAGFAAGRLDAQGVALVFSSQRDDAFRHGRGKQQSAAGLRRRVEEEFEILAKAHVEHFVGLVEHDRRKARKVERAALQMVAQPPRRADDDGRAGLKRTALGARVHAADAGGDPRPGLRVKPAQLLRDLERQLAGRGDDEAERGAERRGLFRRRRGVSDAMARPKATVLPDPVWAETRMSRPSASGRSTAAWTGVCAS